MADQPTFRDNFTTLDRTRWSTTFLDGTRTLPANNEAQCYEDSGIATGASGLVLTATRGASNSLGLPWRSGMLCEFTSQARTWGYWEIVAQMPSGPGFWPAFWSLFIGGWPPENDIVEMIGNTQKLFCSIHSKDPNAKQIASYPATVSDASVGFHKFGGYCGPDRIAFYYDDALVGTAPAPSDYNAGQFMLLNLAVGGPGSWPVSSFGPVPSSVNEAYFRVKRYSYYALGSWPSGQAIPNTLAATLSDTGGTTIASHAASANGTMVRTPANGPIYDASGVPFALVVSSASGIGQQIVISGALVSNTQNVDILYYNANVVYQHNTYGTWYSITEGGVSTQLSGSPPGYTAPVVHATSANGTTLRVPADGTIYDASGVAFTLVASTTSLGQQIAINSVVVANTQAVDILYYNANVVYQHNTYGDWYSLTEAGVGTKLSALPPGYTTPVVVPGTSHLPAFTLPTAGNLIVRVYATATSTAPLAQSGPITVS